MSQLALVQPDADVGGLMPGFRTDHDTITQRGARLMYKIISKLAVGLVSVWSLSASAHYTIIAGKMVYHSLQCDAVLKSVPNPDAHPGELECVASTALIEVLCENPTNHQVAPGQSATQVVLVGEKQIDQSDITDKVRGKANVSVVLPDDSLLKPEFCVNSNWNPIDVIVRATSATLKAYKCEGPDADPCSEKILTSTLEMNCALPAGYGFDNYPLNLPPPGTPYECSQPVIVHVD